MNILISFVQCFLYCIFVCVVILGVYFFFHKDEFTKSDYVSLSCVLGLFCGFVLFFLLLFSSHTECEFRSTSEIVSENNLVNLKLISGQDSDFYMFLGSGEGRSSIDFTYFYYIEDDGKYKPQKIDMNNAVFADLSNGSDVTPRVVTTKITKAQYSKCDNSWLGNILHIDLSNDWEQVSGLFLPPVDVQEVTTFYIPTDKISKEINPNLN